VARKQEKSVEAGADVLILDLEDAVAQSEKPNARRMTCRFLQDARSKPGCPKLYVRINDLTKVLTEDDLGGVMPGAPDGIMLPKAEGGRDIAELGRRLAAHEQKLGLTPGSTKIIRVATETAAAVLALPTVAGSSDRLSALTWGGEDLAADVGAESKSEEHGGYTAPYVVARSMALFAAIAAGARAIDTAYINYKDTSAFEKDCKISRRDGLLFVSMDIACLFAWSGISMMVPLH
jgi:citrate lyase subunit beta/citryl-CoA lyase